jgi:hypothetical protein
MYPAVVATSNLTSNTKPSSAVSRATSIAARQRASTIAAYDKDVTRFVNVFGGEIPCDADLLIRYIVESCKRLAPGTIARRCLAIQSAHLRGGFPTPTSDPRIREALRLMARGSLPLNLLGDTKSAKALPSKLRADKRCAKAISRALLTRMIEAMGSGFRSADRRDKVVLLLGFAGLKRSEISATNLESVRFTDDAMLLRQPNDPEPVDATKVRSIAIPFTRGPLCAATAVQAWIDHCDWSELSGALLTRLTRGGEPAVGQRLDAGYVNVIVKERLKAAGIEDVSDYTAESLRRGGKEEAIRRGR